MSFPSKPPPNIFFSRYGQGKLGRDSHLWSEPFDQLILHLNTLDSHFLTHHERPRDVDIGQFMMLYQEERRVLRELGVNASVPRPDFVLAVEEVQKKVNFKRQSLALNELQPACIISSTMPNDAVTNTATTGPTATNAGPRKTRFIENFDMSIKIAKVQFETIEAVIEHNRAHRKRATSVAEAVVPYDVTVVMKSSPFQLPVKMKRHAHARSGDDWGTEIFYMEMDGDEYEEVGMESASPRMLSRENSADMLSVYEGSFPGRRGSTESRKFGAAVEAIPIPIKPKFTVKPMSDYKLTPNPFKDY